MIVIPSLNFRRPAMLVALACTALAGGCASDGGGLFTTGSVTEPAALTKTASVDPGCTTLASQIDGLRKEGTVDRLEKAADGKSATVSVQRASLNKQAQLNKANADFIAKCGPNLPKSTMASVAAPSAVAAPAVAAATTGAPAKAAAAVVKAKTPAVSDLGVTVAPQAAAAAAAKAAAPQ